MKYEELGIFLGATTLVWSTDLWSSNDDDYLGLGG